MNKHIKSYLNHTQVNFCAGIGKIVRKREVIIQKHLLTTSLCEGFILVKRLHRRAVLKIVRIHIEYNQVNLRAIKSRKMKHKRFSSDIEYTIFT